MSANAVSTSTSAQVSAADVKPVRLDAKVSNELGELWRSIFQRAHEQQHDGEDRPAPVASRSAAHDEKTVRKAVRNSGDASDVKQSLPPPAQVAAPAEQRATGVQAAGDTAPAAAASGEVPRPEATLEPPRPIANASTARAMPDDDEAAPPAVRRAQANDRASVAETTRAAETVSVFMQDGAVTVNVRDALLGEEEALRCAFETARTLTGQRAALRTLMLNGRALYRQAPRPEETVSPTLVFAC